LWDRTADYNFLQDNPHRVVKIRQFYDYLNSPGLARRHNDRFCPYPWFGLFTDPLPTIQTNFTKLEELRIPYLTPPDENTRFTFYGPTLVGTRERTHLYSPYINPMTRGTVYEQ
jgi:hypothetical protein